jgi:hypothetical protein
MIGFCIMDSFATGISTLNTYIDGVLLHCRPKGNFFERSVTLHVTSMLRTVTT